MTNFRLICVGALLLLTATACKKHNSQSGSNNIVYVVGSVPGVNGLQPVYWKNGVSNSLPAMLSGVADAIVIADTNIYIGGTCFTDTGQPVITYWKNGVLNVLRNYNFPGGGAAIAVSGSDLYLTGNGYVGSGYSSPSYWKNGTIDTLPAVGSYTATTAIAVSSGDVYVAGNEDTLNGTAEYWKNGVATSLGPGTALTMTAAGQDVYVAGEAFTAGSLELIAALWKNGVAIPLASPNPTYKEGRAWAVTISGSDVYVAGYTYEKLGSDTTVATYWKNGSPVTLGLGRATGICVLGSNVYVSGDKYAGGGTFDPVYWKNGVLIPLPGSGGEAVAIAVIPQ